MQEGCTKKLQVRFSFNAPIILAKYFRIGHMGVSVTERGMGDLRTALNALQKALTEVDGQSDYKAQRRFRVGTR